MTHQHCARLRAPAVAAQLLACAAVLLLFAVAVIAFVISGPLDSHASRRRIAGAA